MPLVDLPYDMLREILSHLPREDRMTMRATSKTICDHVLWQDIFTSLTLDGTAVETPLPPGCKVEHKIDHDKSGSFRHELEVANMDKTFECVIQQHEWLEWINVLILCPASFHLEVFDFDDGFYPWRSQWADDVTGGPPAYIREFWTLKASSTPKWYSALTQLKKLLRLMRRIKTLELQCYMLPNYLVKPIHDSYPGEGEPAIASQMSRPINALEDFVAAALTGLHLEHTMEKLGETNYRYRFHRDGVKE
ncbi:hypothetical protein K491DRAFT_782437 [Lophiostoma macrostomum CBS 122681]|uniref:F-box domain-containing protein n=1 Tax=Lophiostoma macrostomum CBS 122681 TaxID=1314788 RepID=A0A6A6SUF3_9PLEO|nr:hypothetical protein K491DRAFT_782437 [Lophiostoma macrostomum CBS 122681]